MSIREAWKKRVEEKRLFKLGFLIPGPAEKRTVLMSPEINKLVSGPWANSLMGDRCARVRADLENVLAGKPLVVCWDPFKGRERHQIGRLDPVEDHIFDIRCVDPRPGLRVIFHFAEKDVLVTHLCSPRSVPVPWLHRLPLLKRTSKEWKNAITESSRQWRSLFPEYPLTRDLISMTISQTSFLAEVAAGHSGSPIPAAKRAYFQQRLRNRIFNFLLEKFLSGQESGLTKAILARRIEKTPDVINRWLGAPSNLTLDTVSDLLLGIAAEEFEPNSSSPLAQVQSNYSHFEELISASDLVEKANSRLGKQSAEDIRAQPQTPLDTGHSALAASMLNYDQGTKIIKQHLGER